VKEDGLIKLLFSDEKLRTFNFKLIVMRYAELQMGHCTTFIFHLIVVLLLE
jgi:hypothetical protein